MGSNHLYTVWEQTVITLYDKAALTLDVLDAISEPYRNTDIDSGGSKDLLSFDGRRAEEIAISLISPEFESSKDWDFFEEFSIVSSERWGWR